MVGMYPFTLCDAIVVATRLPSSWSFHRIWLWTSRRLPFTIYAKRIQWTFFGISQILNIFYIHFPTTSGSRIWCNMSYHTSNGCIDSFRQTIQCCPALRNNHVVRCIWAQRTTFAVRAFYNLYRASLENARSVLHIFGFVAQKFKSPAASRNFKVLDGDLEIRVICASIHIQFIRVRVLHFCGGKEDVWIQLELVRT